MLIMNAVFDTMDWNFLTNFVQHWIVLVCKTLKLLDFKLLLWCKRCLCCSGILYSLDW